MTLHTFGTLFSGGEGAGIGLQAAGLRHCWGVEYDPAIAAVAQRNGFAVTVADVRAVDYTTLTPVDWLHASPVCTRASNANPNATESPEDIDTAAAVVRALDAIRPQVFTLENVWGYRDFAAFKNICKALGDHGYFWDFSHENAADYGVPQTRKRLILRASRGLLPHLPEPVRWVGWYEAIEDLIPTLPESKLAPWQLARLPEELRETVLINSENACQEWGGIRYGNDAAMTIGAGSSPRAVLVDSKNANQEFGKLYRDLGELALTVITDGKESHQPRAVLVKGNEHSSKGVLWSHGRSHDHHGNEYGAVLRDASEPAHTCTAQNGPYNIQLPARVVSMTPRALARFQSVPDWYELPDKRTLAAKVIGNMVPPLLMQRIVETFN